jgi:dCTP diphosphatase
MKSQEDETPLALLTQLLVAFRNERDWGRFHTPRNLTAALAIEAAELQEILLWQSDDESENALANAQTIEKLGHEIADVLIYALLLAHECGIDPHRAILEKVHLNGLKYPVEKAKGNARKYTEHE